MVIIFTFNMHTSGKQPLKHCHWTPGEDTVSYMLILAANLSEWGENSSGLVQNGHLKAISMNYVFYRTYIMHVKNKKMLYTCHVTLL